jgi:hypothetical protein
VADEAIKQESTFHNILAGITRGLLKSDLGKS